MTERAVCLPVLAATERPGPADNVLAVGWRLGRAMRERWHRGLHEPDARARVAKRDRGANLRFPLAAGSALRQKADGVPEPSACGLLLARACPERGMDDVIGEARIRLDRLGDEFYVRNASLWLDLRIVVMTALMFFRGDRRTPHAEAPAWSNLIPFNEPLPRRTAAQRAFAPPRMMPRGKEHAAPSAPRF